MELKMELWGFVKTIILSSNPFRSRFVQLDCMISRSYEIIQISKKLTCDGHDNFLKYHG